MIKLTQVKVEIRRNWPAPPVERPVDLAGDPVGPATALAASASGTAAGKEDVMV